MKQLSFSYPFYELKEQEFVIFPKLHGESVAKPRLEEKQTKECRENKTCPLETKVETHLID